MLLNITRGYMANTCSFSVVALSHLLSVPILISNWGVAGFADYIVLLSFAGLTPLAFAGLPQFLESKLRLAIGDGKIALFQRYLAWAIIFMAASSISYVLLFWVCVPQIFFSIFSLKMLSEADGAVVLFLLSLTFVNSSMILIPRAIYGGLGKYSRTEFHYAGIFLIRTCFCLFVVSIGGGLFEFALSWLIIEFFGRWSIMIADLCRKDHRFLFVNRPAFQRIDLPIKTILFYFVPIAVDVFLISGINLIVEMLIRSADALVFFFTLRTIVNLWRMVIREFSRVGAIEVARLRSRGGPESVRASIILLSRGLSTLGGFGSGISLALLPIIFELWVRGAVSNDSAISAPLFLALAVITPVQPALAMMQLANLPGPLATILLGQALASAGSIFLLGSHFGLIGIVCGLALSEATFQGALGATLMVKYYRVAWKEYFFFGLGSALISFLMGYGTVKTVLLAIKEPNTWTLLAFAVAIIFCVIALCYMALSAAMRVRVLHRLALVVTGKKEGD